MTQLTRRTFNQLMGLAALTGTWGRSGISGAAPRAGTLRIAVGSEPPILTDILQSSANAGVGARVIEGLVRLDFDLRPHPYLATSWRIADDGLTYTFRLRDGVKWHDGRRFTSADVAYSLLTLKEIHPRRRSTFANITAVETPDELTALIRLSQPAPYLITSLSARAAPIIPKHLYAGTDAATNPRNVAPIGTGPFRFQEWVRGSHYILVRNPDYWDAPKPYLDQIIVRFIPDASARAAAFEAGEIDLGDRTPVPLSDLARFKNDPRFIIETRGYEQSGPLSQVFLNLDTPQLADLRVRQAIAHTIDLDVVASTVWQGYARPAPTAISPVLSAFHDTSLRPYKVSPDKARGLLDAAGFPRDGNGPRFRLRLLHNPVEPRLLATAEYIRHALGQVGIACDIRSSDFATYIRRIYTERAFDLDVQTLVNGVDPTDGVQRAFWSRNIKDGLPWSNSAHYSSPEADRLFEDGATEIEPEKRRAIYHRLQKVLYDDLPAINLVAFQWVTVQSARLQNAITDADGALGNFADARFA